MTKETRKEILIAACMLAAFLLWTAAVSLMDVQAIGPQASAVGFSSLNGFVHRLTGVHMSLYLLTDWLSLVPAGFVMGFGLLGLAQWIQRKHLLKVDGSILVLGGFYLVVLAVYAFFEIVVVNCRPVLIEGILEASYPSSTTVLVLCVMSTAAMQLHERIANRRLRRWSDWIIAAFILFMVAGRVLSGVHWISDIIGGILLSAGLVMLYHSISRLAAK